MTPKYLFFLANFLLITALNAAVFGQFRFDRWSTDNGLPQNGVRGIARTLDGYLWATTFDGLARFDGLKIDTFNKGNTPGILNNRFIGLFVNKEGVLFARTEDGSLTIYEDGNFSTLTPEQVPNDSISYIMAGENGETLFQTYNAADKSKYWYEYKDGEFIFKEKYAVADFNQQRIYKSSSGRVWTVNRKKTTESFLGKETVYPLDLSRTNLEVALFEDSQNGLWVGESKVYHLSNGKIRTFDEKDGLIPIVSYHSFLEEPDGSIWFASSGGPSGGIGLVRQKEGKISFWNKDKGLSSDIYAIFQDKQSKQLFFATDEGLFSRKNEVIKTFNTKNSNPKIEAYPIIQDKKGTIWIGTNRGLFILENEEFRSVHLKMEKTEEHFDYWENPKVSVQSLWQDEQERLWIGTNGTAFIVKDGKAKEIKEARHLSVFAIQPDKNGNIWLATNKGVLQFRDEKIVNKFTVKDGLAGDFVTVVFEDSKGAVWFGGQNGLAKYTDGKFKTYSKSYGLPVGIVRSIYEDADGVLWIGTYDEGLVRFKNGKFFNIREKDGLFSNGVFAIREDQEGNFWVSSNQGIYRAKRRQLNYFADGKIKNLNSVSYGKSDGMVSIECNGGAQPSSIIDKDGYFWFPTQEGVVRVDSKAEIYYSLPPPVIIESATIERGKVDVQEKITVAAGSRNVEIFYSAISFNKPEQTKFKYKLEGYDTDWVESGTRRSAFYSYIPPGDYVFRVQSANSDGIWNETGATLEIQSLPFFYQTNLFYLLGALVFILIALSSWRYSVYNFKRREMKLTRLVAERTAELNAANEELQLLADFDVLTKISNRRVFEKFLKDEWNRAVRSKGKISLILLDVDYFKLYNDTYGHQAGDDCLQKIAQTIAETVKRPGDLAARFGGEEFIVGLGGTDEEGSIEIAKQLLENINNLQILHETSEVKNTITISLGIATLSPKEGNAESDLIKNADEALYKAKENGRNGFYLISEPFDDASVLDEQIIL